MAQPRHDPKYRGDEARVSSLGIKVNVCRMMDDDCERRSSTKSVERLEVTLAANSGHCMLRVSRA